MSDFNETHGDRTNETGKAAAETHADMNRSLINRAESIKGPSQIVKRFTRSREITITPEESGGGLGSGRQEVDPQIIEIDEIVKKPYDGSEAESEEYEESPGGSAGEGEEAFGVTEARSDLGRARSEVRLNIQDLTGLSSSDDAKTEAVIAETRALNRLLEAIDKLLAGGQPVPAGLAVSVTVRVEMMQDAARQAAEHADAELKGVLKRVLERIPKIGREILSMNLHLFPVKEWKLGGEVSAFFVKGTIEVTFGKGM
jgi:hypothetical protein